MDDVVQAEPTAEELAAERARERHERYHQQLAEYNMQPHPRLQALLGDLQAPRHDLHDRIGAIQNGLIRLVQIIMAHTPEAGPVPVEETEETPHGEG